ncbi:hypothetical protein P3T36_004274 [Kitasatospora sp. MAP12-15]|uniref:hypothetical protein n=1 Tax=unclassified Kitasatospora TaxID=2633591 RepID=UPI002476084A|nr:hypothetical protein [Kitasatospora sp. MAP12-44]MDH6108261.1 hypothetical protein [Kitasatospora sp. MAP12-44]
MSSTEPGPSESPNDRELDEMRRRIAQLEASTEPRKEHHRLRIFGATVLIVVASVLSLLAVIAVWTHDVATDTNRFVAALAPLAHNPDVQGAVADRVTNSVVQQIDVAGVVNQLSTAAADQGVPPRLAQLVNGLSGPLSSALTDLIHGAAERVVTSEAFATVWEQALRAGHSTMNKALTGEGGGVVQLTNNEVTVDIAPAVQQVKAQLVDAGFAPAARIPDIHTDFVIFSSPDLAKIKSAFRLLGILGDWLPVVAVLVAAAGVFTAVSRRRALIGASLGIAAAMLLLGITLAVFRSYFLDHLPSDASPAAAGAVFDALVVFLRQAVRAVGVLAVLVALGAFLTGPSRAAAATRRIAGSGMAGARSAADSVGFRAGPVEPFVRRWKRWIGIAILLVAAVVFVFWAHPTAIVVFWFAVAVLAAFAVREFLAPSVPA